MGIIVLYVIKTSFKIVLVKVEVILLVSVRFEAINEEIRELEARITKRFSKHVIDLNHLYLEA